MAEPPERNAYAAHEALVAPARRNRALWRLVAGLVLAVVVTLALNTVLQALLLAIDRPFWSAELAGRDAQGQTPLSLLVLLGSFAFMAIGVGLAAKALHGRAPLGLIGEPGLAIWQFWRVVRMLFIIGFVLMLLPPYDMGEPLTANLPLGTWLALLPLSLAVLVIQTGTEELLFRGYLQQTLAARFSSPLIWIGVPSALFALGHYLPAEAGDNALLIALWAGIFGVLMADLTARAGTLGPAIAVHAVNNFTALLIVSVPDSLSGLSLYVTPYSLSDTEDLRNWLVVDFAVMLVSWLGARVAIGR